MKAVTAEKPGGPDVLKLSQVEKPSPAAGELLVKVKACALNPVDYKIREGYFSEGREYPAIYGYDVSGVVEKTGGDVSGFRPGDEVFYFAELGGQGAYAEYHAVREDIVAMKPENLGHIEAASLPLAGCTAWQALFGQAGLEMGETALIYGAAGGVGSLAVQMAAWAGATVLAVCSEKNIPFVEKLDPDYVINYEGIKVVDAALELTEQKGVDVAFDTVGGDVFFECVRAIKPFGRIAFLNAFGDDNGRTLASLNPARIKNAAIHCALVRNKRSSMEAVAKLARRGFVKPQVERVISLEEVAEGHRRLQTRHGRGKIVIDMERV